MLDSLDEDDIIETQPSTDSEINLKSDKDQTEAENDNNPRLRMKLKKRSLQPLRGKRMQTSPPREEMNIFGGLVSVMERKQHKKNFRNWRKKPKEAIGGVVKQNILQ